MPKNDSGLDRRLSRRLDNHLTRRDMSDGGEVFSGPLASRALRAVGARAMTVSRAIVVDTTFDTSDVEDRALYAHEKVHLDHSGGAAGHNTRDAEEVAARAAEAMVFHRAAAEGGYEGGHSPGRGGSHSPGDKGGGGELAAAPAGANERPESEDASPDPERGYFALIDQGYSHADIVHELVQRCVSALAEAKSSSQDRHSDKKGYL